MAARFLAKLLKCHRMIDSLEKIARQFSVFPVHISCLVTMRERVRRMRRARLSQRG